MRFGNICGTVAAIGLALVVSAPVAEAKSHTPSASAVHGNARAIKAGMTRHAMAGGRAYYGRGGISCVPFARENSGIELSGNAYQWWSNAEGLYQRGAKPEVGSVLNFRANGRMRMGHVAVVTNVVDARNVEIDHANWSGPGASRGGVSRDITVVDVSERNDWTAVRVALGHTNDFGSVYPTYGFIYDRPDRGTMVANNQHAPAPLLNAAPRDLRPAYERMQGGAAQEVEEVAEAAEDYRPRGRRVAAHHQVRGKAGLVKVKSGAAATHKRTRHHT